MGWGEFRGDHPAFGRSQAVSTPDRRMHQCPECDQCPECGMWDGHRVGCAAIIKSPMSHHTSHGTPKPRVRKNFWNPGDPKPWMVSNHWAGSASFETWEQAMQYANTYPILMNGAGEVMRSTGQDSNGYGLLQNYAGVTSGYLSVPYTDNFNNRISNIEAPWPKMTGKIQEL